MHYVNRKKYKKKENATPKNTLYGGKKNPKLYCYVLSKRKTHNMNTKSIKYSKKFVIYVTTVQEHRVLLSKGMNAERSQRAKLKRIEAENAIHSAIFKETKTHRTRAKDRQ